MCGIAGILNPDSVRERKIFPEMLNTLTPRGPDEAGVYFDEKVILGSRRLSIVDLEGGKQPISSEDDSIWVVLNGEIYNYEELTAHLKSRGHIFKTKTDTEVLVHLYEEDGEKFVEKLRGMFAFALYDKRKQVLILARDRVGKKPLFYTKKGKKIYFASEIKALLKHPDILKRPNFQALYHYFTLKHIPRPWSAFEGIYSLLPAEMMIVSESGAVTKKRYWSPSFEPVAFDEASAIDRLEEKLKEAVRLRVYASDVPVGAFLSGGLDSSLVVALMREYAGGELHTFSLAYDEEENPDIPFARQMATLLSTTHHEYTLKTSEVPEAIPGIIEAFDEPFGGVVSTFFLSKLIAKYVKVALSGDGADELFGSYANHRLAWPIYYYLKGDSRWESWTNEKERVKMLANPNPAFWRMQLYSFNDEIKRNFLTENFLSHLNGESTYTLVEDYFKTANPTDPLNQVLEVDFHHLLPDEVLTYVDRLSMAQSVEVRSPFLDQEVIMASTELSGKYKINPHGTKDILRKLAVKYLPQNVVERPKKGFVLPFHKWLLGSLGSFTREHLSPKKLNKTGVLRGDAIQELIAKQEQGVHDYTYGLFSLLMFQLWWERYVNSTAY